MWAGMLHLVFGNWLIGVGEGLLLSRLFSLPKTKTSTAMILANYLSAWIGGFLVCGVAVDKLPLDLNNGWMWFWILVLVTYVMTLFFEWPFVAWCLRRNENWFWQSLRGSFFVQSASYVLLFGWYWLASGTSLYTQMKVVAPADLSLPESVLVYFIAPGDGCVWKRPLSGGSGQKVRNLDSKGHNDRLFIHANVLDTNHWDLVARLDASERPDVRFIEVLTNLSVVTAPDRRSNPEGTWFNFGRVQTLGCATNSDWSFWAGFWSMEGLRASRKSTREQVKFSYETPFGSWTVRNAVHLPTDKVLFQLGHDQICAIDPESRKVALLWHGRGPVPVIFETNSTKADEPAVGHALPQFITP